MSETLEAMLSRDRAEAIRWAREVLEDERTEDLGGMPDFDELFPALYALLASPPRRVVVYNASYDRMVLEEAAEAYGHEPTDLPVWECAMRRYAEYVGDWNEERRSYRWQRLEGGDHSAVGDARATLRTIREMASADAPARELEGEA